MSNQGTPPFRGQKLNWGTVYSTQTATSGSPKHYKTKELKETKPQKAPKRALEAPYLNAKLDTLQWNGGQKPVPLLLAGPILRRVTYDSVTVWFAAKEQCTVTLQVDELSKWSQPGSRNPTYTSASTTTRQVGKNLHIGCVTVDTASPTPKPETLYYYDLRFDSHSGKTLGSKGIVSASSSNQSEVPELAFGDSPVDNKAPTFTFPAKTLENLRVAFGSCRKPHGQGKDALPAVHGMLKNAVDKPANRPNHLVLGGDQIYADDVADQLLAMLINHGRRLLGWNDDLPATMLRGNGQLRLEAWPGRREQPYVLQIAGLSAAGYGSSHLLTLGEYLAMYLCVWSPVLWPDPTSKKKQFQKFFPTADDVWPHRNDKVQVKYRKDWGPRQVSVLDEEELKWDWERNWLKEDVAGAFSDKIEAMLTFRRTLEKVRRLLANVPVYMIFDDHEVTDDWFISENNVKQVFGATPEDPTSGETTGQRVIENGMLAYTVCQAWGNDPDKFDSKPGSLLLDYLEDVAKAGGDQTATKSKLANNTQELGTILGRPLVEGQHKGVDREAVGDDDKRVYDLSKRSIKYAWEYAGNQPNDPVEYHYHITFGDGGSPGADYELLVFDTRTKRRYPEGQGAILDELKEWISGSSPPPELISDEALATQRPKRGTPSDLELTVAVSPVPPWTVPSVNSGQKLFALKRMVNNTMKSPGKPTPPSVISPVERAEKEHWRLQRAALERFVSVLGTRGATDTTSPNQHRVLLLSGDVHYGYGVRGQYWADKPYISKAQQSHWQGFDFSSTTFETVIASCTASAAKNSGDASRLLQGTGYHSVPEKVGTPSTGVVGLKPDSEAKEWKHRMRESVLNPWYLIKEDVSNDLLLTEYALHPLHALKQEAKTTDRTLLEQTLDDLQYDVRRFMADLSQIKKQVTAPDDPEWQYRIDYLVNDYTEGVTKQQLKQRTKNLNQKYSWWVNDLRANLLIEAEDYGRHIIGYNNIGDVTLNWSGETAKFSLWWRVGGKKSNPVKNHATYDVSLGFNDGRYERPNDVVKGVDLP